MIRVQLESDIIEPTNIVTFNFRRHLQPLSRGNENKLYLTAKDKDHPTDDLELYPLRINGATNTVLIRKDVFEKLGFKIEISE